MPNKPNEPHSVVAVVDSGLSFPCTFRFDGLERIGIFLVRNYRVFIEFPREKLHVVRFEIADWPDDVQFIFDVPGLSTDEASQWITGVEMREVKPPTNDDGTVQRIRVE